VRSDRVATTMPMIEQLVRSIDPQQRVMRLRTMDEIVAETMSDSRFDAWLYGVFAALALMLTMIGVYGLVAFFVAQRTNEIGIRLALGASRGGVLAMVLKQGAGLIVAGLAVGLAGAVFVTRSFEKLLYGVKANDPRAFVAVALVLLIVGAIASLIPARRASKVDPMIALRYE
jgi:putative ABC transport system permease protein